MTSKGPASLTSALIATKGNAAPAGLLAMNRKAGSLRPAITSTARISDPVTGGSAPKGSAKGNNGRAHRPRLTLRLDPGRHLKIKLAAAHLNLSLQEIMIDALDRYLVEVKPQNLVGDCNCLAGPVADFAGEKNHSSG